MKLKLWVFLGALTFLAGCASMHRGVVAMKIDERTAHVGLNSDEVAVGDHVELYGSQCTGGGKQKEARACTKILKGHGTVTKILGANYTEVQFDSGVAFQEGDFIEKHSH